MNLTEKLRLKQFNREVIRQSLQDISVELADEFDRNFQRKAFFGKPWQRRKFDSGQGSLLINSGALRRSISEPSLMDKGIRFSSDLPYAAIHNDGGQISVTAKMKSYFWARYYEATGKVSRTAKGEKRITKKNIILSSEADFYKAMALKKIGSKINIPQRQFIGDDPEVLKIINRIVNENIKQYFKQ